MRRNPLGFTPTLENNRPDLTRKHTTKHQVSNGLRLLIAQGATSRMWQSSSGKSIGGPASILKNQPDKETAAHGGPRTPQILRTRDHLATTKKCRISRGSGISSIRAPAPSEGIHTIREHHLVDQRPDLQKLKNSLLREIRVNKMDPSMIAQSRSHRQASSRRCKMLKQKRRLFC